VSRGDLSEGEWRTLQAALPVARTGRPPEDLRRTINGILWRVRTGTPWRDVPEKLRQVDDGLPALPTLEPDRGMGSHRHHVGPGDGRR